MHSKYVMLSTVYSDIYNDEIQIGTDTETKTDEFVTHNLSTLYH